MSCQPCPTTLEAPCNDSPPDWRASASGSIQRVLRARSCSQPALCLFGLERADILAASLGLSKGCPSWMASAFVRACSGAMRLLELLASPAPTTSWPKETARKR